VNRGKQTTKANIAAAIRAADVKSGREQIQGEDAADL